MKPETVQKYYKECRDATKEWRSEARELYDLIAGKQWTEQEEATLKEKKRLPIVMNRIAPYIDSIIGTQVNNRKEVRYLPRENSDSQLADLYTEAGRWADDLCDAEDEVSDSFYDMIVCGMGWTETRMDYASDPDGQLITAERVDPLEMYWDVDDSSRNMTKSGWVIRAKKYPRDEAEEKWPKIKDAMGETGDYDERLREPHDATNAWKYENDQSAWDPNDSTYLVLQCQYYEDVPAYRVADPESGQVLTMAAAKVDKMKPYLDAMGVKYVKSSQRKYWQCFVSGNVELESAEAPSQKGFTLRCMTGKRDRNKKHWYGVVRALKDPQKFSNKFFSDIMFILATNRKGGAFVEIDALDNPRKAEEDWASPDALIKLKSGGLAKVRERDAGVFPTGLDRLMQYAIDAVPATSGLNPEMIGMADRAQAGVLEQQRKESALTILAPLFDALKRHQRGRGRIVLDFLHRFIADGRIIRISAPNGQKQAVPFNPAPDADTFDIIVDEQQASSNSKQETFAVLSQLVPFMAKMGVTPPADVLDYLPLPSTLIEKWRQQIEQASQNQQQDPAAQMEMAKLNAQQQSEQAKAQLAMLQMQADRQKQEADLYLAQQEAKMKEAQLQLDALVAQKEAEMKAAELQLRQYEVAMSAQAVNQEGQDRQAAQADTSGAMNAMVQTMQSMHEMHRSAMETHAQTMERLAKALSAPREVIRDAKGKAVGTRAKVD